MAHAAGRILLNGNAESVERFTRLAHLTLGESSHRNPRIREVNRILICAGAWGAGEVNDGQLRRGFEQHGRTEVENLYLYTNVRRFLEQRPLVQTLYDEHEQVWWELFDAYSEENSATVERLRRTLNRAEETFPGVDQLALLKGGDHRPPGPRSRPARVFLKSSYARQAQRALGTLREADRRHAGVLRGLWKHFHLAAGLEFDPLWQGLREELVNAVLSSSGIVLPGGSPSRLLLGLRFFRLEGVFSEALRRGTCFFGSSAGAMSLGRRVVIFNDNADPREEFQLLENGIRMIEGLQIFPHCTDRVHTSNPVNLGYLAARFSNRACVGLDQGSVLELRPSGGAWHGRSVGDEQVIFFGRSGAKMRFEPGEDVPLRDLVG